MKCPACATEMDAHLRHGVTIDHCPACGGVWLEKGELDHLIAAVRPVVELPDPEHDPEPIRSARTARPAPARDKSDGPRAAAEPERYAHRGREAHEGAGRARRYGGQYSRRVRLRDVLEEIFDFD